jgi:hypothetical protein
VDFEFIGLTYSNQVFGQIVALQALHYLTLSILVPPLLIFFCDPYALEYEGGTANVGMIMDWREIAGRQTIGGGVGVSGWNVFKEAWKGGWKGSLRGETYPGSDAMRGWVLAGCWILSSGVE